MSEVSTDIGNLALPFTTFIGRSGEMHEVTQRLQAHRLVTITGVGGAGKSRLAVEVAASLKLAFADGVWLVELALTRDPELVPEVVASTLRVPRPLGPSPFDALSDHLAHAELLLLLDNCEHPIGATARLVEHLLRHVPGLRVLATSRERIGITGESLWRVPGLAVPKEQAGVDNLVAEFDSIKLFIERASALEPTFELTAATAEPVARICRRLDGLPLAIELAAARVGTDGISSISAGMEHPFAVLTRGSRTANPRHQTLTALVQWSYDLLEPQQQALFDRLSVFVGGFTIQAAATVWRETAAEPVPDVRELMGDLVDKSLVATDSAPGGHIRYRLLETLRIFAAANLRIRGEEQAVRGRHAAYAQALADRAWSHIRGPEQRALLDELELEHGNLRAALEFIVSTGDGGAALGLAGALAPFWDLRGHYTEGRALLHRALQLDSPRDAVKVRAMNGYATLTLIQGDAEEAISTFQAAFGLAQAIGDHGGASYALQYLAFASVYTQELDHAEELIRQALFAAHQADDTWLTAWALVFRCDINLERGDFAAAAQDSAAACDLFGPEGDPEGIAWCGLSSAAAAWAQRDLETARDGLADGLSGFRTLGGSWGLSLALALAAQIARSMEWWELGIPLLSASDTLRTSLGVALLPFIDRWQGEAATAGRMAAGAERFEELWARGAGWSLSTATHEVAVMLGAALGEGAPSTAVVPPRRVPATNTVPVTPPPPEKSREAVLRRDGDYWTLAWTGPAFRLRSSLGLGYLSRLVLQPRQEVHVLDLMLGAGGQRPDRGRVAGPDSEPVLDEQAKAAYKKRLDDLAEDLEEAERWSDAGRVAHLHAEIDALTDHLAAAVGLGGRSRRMRSEAERARVNVTKAIRSAIQRILDEDPDLGQHLQHSVRTGIFCSYEPDASAQLHWRS